MLQLYFNPQKFPRTITREEWREIWRWKRITEKKLREEMSRQLANLATYGITHPEYLERFVNPPLLVHDKQEL